MKQEIIDWIKYGNSEPEPLADYCMCPHEGLDLCKNPPEYMNDRGEVLCGACVSEYSNFEPVFMGD